MHHARTAAWPAGILCAFAGCAVAGDYDHDSDRGHGRDDQSIQLGPRPWSFERADLRQGASKAGFYYAFDPQGRALRKDSDTYLALDALAQEVGVMGIFSDWPATVSY